MDAMHVAVCVGSDVGSTSDVNVSGRRTSVNTCAWVGTKATWTICGGLMRYSSVDWESIVAPVVGKREESTRTRVESEYPPCTLT